MISPFWVTAFRDFPVTSFDDGVRFWRGVTGYGLSAFRGEHREFATLEPASGDAFLRVFVTTDGPVPGIADRIRDDLPNALDVHLVYERADAEGLRGRGAAGVGRAREDIVLRRDQPDDRA